MRTERSKTHIKLTFDSVSEIAAVALRHADSFLELNSIRKSWYGVASIEEAHQLAVNGWHGETSTVLDISERAVSTVKQVHDTPSFSPVWDVSGCEVDVSRYLSGEPENMIQYDIRQATSAGNVVVLCASVAYSSAVSTDTMRRRGYGIAALAFALNDLGYSTELWADQGASKPGGAATLRVLVKGANDELDPSKIMFAYSHPAMLRAIHLPAMFELPKSWRKHLSVGAGSGAPTSPRQDMPDGTIYLPAACSDWDVPDADKMLIKYFRQLGIIDN